MLRETEQKIREKIKSIKAAIKENSARIGEAAALGDLKENAEYKAAKEEQVILHRHLERYQGYLTNVTIIDKRDLPGDRITFGTKVKLRDMNTEEVEEYTVVGSAEFELELYPNVMTNTSRLARALMGKKPGEVVEVVLPKNKTTYEILEIDLV
jgi:transcription elongation factor GreA